LEECAVYCHSRIDVNMQPQAPQRALDFFGDPADSTFGIISVASLSQAGTARPMLRVAPGDSARSVLLRKLLGGDAHEKSGDQYPVMGVDGRRMPLDAAPLDGDSILVIQHWIDGGAVVN
jgi:hypothetical protein